VNWGRSLLLGVALAAAGSIAALSIAELRPDARSEGRESAAVPTPGAVPLVKAEPGPIKVKPEDPGGLKVPHKDKSIYERFETHRKVVPAADPAKGKATTPKAGEKKLAQAIGPYRIQLGSFESNETAQKRWNEIKNKHSDVMGGLTMVIERVELKAKGTMYRLQAGPLKSADEVQKVCGALAKRKVGCFLVKS
jgi:cell division septation protein DedD